MTNIDSKNRPSAKSQAGSNENKVSVMIADDHLMVAEGLALVMEGSGAASVVAKAVTLEETVCLLGEHRPDVLLLDVALPDGDGIDALPRLTSASPATRIIILTMYAEAAVIRRAMEAGVHGFLLKSAAADELIAAIRTVGEGNTYVCHEAGNINRRVKEASPTLTQREREVLRLIIQGLTIKEIAGELCLSFETVHSYTKYLRQKLGCNNTASLVRVAIEQHLV